MICVQIEWFNGAKDLLMHKIIECLFIFNVVFLIENIKFLHFEAINKNKFNDKVFEIPFNVHKCTRCASLTEFDRLCVFDKI